MTTVTAKGQVTIPKAVRDQLGIAPGSRVEFHRADDGSVVLKRAAGKHPEGRFQHLRGHAGPGPDTSDIMALTRGDEAGGIGPAVDIPKTGKSENRR